MTMPPRLETLEDLRRALDTTLDHLEGVLSSEPDMPSYQGTYEDASEWLDATRAALEATATGRRDAGPPPPPPSAPGRVPDTTQTQMPAVVCDSANTTTIPSPPPSAHDVSDE